MLNVEYITTAGVPIMKVSNVDVAYHISIASVYELETFHRSLIIIDYAVQKRQ